MPHMWICFFIWPTALNMSKAAAPLVNILQYKCQDILYSFINELIRLNISVPIVLVGRGLQKRMSSLIDDLCLFPTELNRLGYFDD